MTEIQKKIIYNGTILFFLFIILAGINNIFHNIFTNMLIAVYLLVLGIYFWVLNKRMTGTIKNPYKDLYTLYKQKRSNQKKGKKQNG